jgi:hypothetical protein
MKNPIPALSRSVATTVAIAAGVLAPSAMGASGDLDPIFGDVGRIGPIVDLDGPAWSLEIRDDDAIVFAGGDFDVVCPPSPIFCDFGEFSAAGHIARLTPSGQLDSSIDAPDLVDIQVLTSPYSQTTRSSQ